MSPKHAASELARDGQESVPPVHPSSMTEPRASIIIAAHDEEAVIGRCLDTLLAGAEPGEFEVVVAANGCRDRTAEVAAARPGVRVVALPQPSKTAALNAAEQVATAFPRLYLDADITVTAHDVRTLTAALEGPILVASPARRLDTAGRPLAVRAYFAVQRHLPAFDDGLFGRGLIAVSRAGRARFTVFPEVIADDLFLDSLYAAGERLRVDGVTTVVATPYSTPELLGRLARVRRGNAALRRTRVGVRPADRWAWLRSSVLPRPWLLPAGVIYAALTGWASLKAVRSSSWGRDGSTRS